MTTLCISSHRLDHQIGDQGGNDGQIHKKHWRYAPVLPELWQRTIWVAQRRCSLVAETGRTISENEERKDMAAPDETTDKRF